MNTKDQNGNSPLHNAVDNLVNLQKMDNSDGMKSVCCVYFSLEIMRLFVYI